MQTTINQLRVELEAIQQAHGQLNDFFWGSFERSQDETNQGLRYPLMCCYYNEGPNIAGNTVPINLFIIIADRVYDDFSNLKDTESDTLQVAKDIVNIMQNTPRWNKIGRVQSAPIRKFIEAREDKVTGHLITMTFTIFDNKNVCDIPIFGYDTEGSFQPQCAPVTITDSDGTTTVEVDAGGSFVCTPVEPVTVKNPSGSYLVIANPGDTVTTPNIDVTLDGGDTVLNVESVKDIDLSEYFEILAPTGSRVPVNSVSDPTTQTLWTSKSSSVTTGTGVVTKNGTNGWDGRSNFIIDTNRDFELSFVIPTTGNVIAGISMISTIDSYEDIDFGFYTLGGGFNVFSDGIGMPSSGPYNGTDTLSIRRVNGNIIMRKAGATVYTFVSPHPFLIGSVMIFDCSIFSASNRIENISITYLS